MSVRKLLTVDTVNPLLRDMRHTASEVATRAEQIERELRKGITKPFTEVIHADINDIQAMGQKPVTFTRQVLTACAYPHLLSDPFVPSDVKARSDKILDECGGRSAGSEGYYFLTPVFTAFFDPESSDLNPPKTGFNP